MKNRVFISTVSILIFWWSAASPHLPGQDSWIGGSGTNWNTPANWDTGLVPNTTTSTATVGAPAPADATLSLDIAALTVLADGIVNSGPSTSFDFSGMSTTSLTNMGIINVLNNSDFQLQGTVNNSGILNSLSAGNLTDFEVDTAAQLSGGGTVALSGSLNARIVGVNSAVLTVENQTLEGRGQIGANTMALELNADALIDANTFGAFLVMDMNATLGTTGFGVVNDGTMRASNGGILQITSDSIDNTNGTIEALADSIVNLENNAVIVGGLVRSVGTGEVQQGASTNVFLEDLTVDADLTTANNSDLGISGTINNTGSISMNSAGNLTDLEVQAGGAHLTGGGTVNLRGSFNARIMGSDILTVDDQTIQGQGQIGANSIALELSPNALVDANEAGLELVMDLNASAGSTGFGVINDGTIRASNGGILRIENDSIDNTNGVIEALADSTLSLQNNAVIVGGLVRSIGTGQVQQGGSTNVFLEDLTVDADLNTANNSDLGITGTINNTGSISINSAGNQTDLEVQAGGAHLTGGGTVNLTGSTNARIMGSGILTIDDQTIQGRGQIGANSIALELSSNALVDANVNGAEIVIDLNAAAGSTGFGVINDGTMRASNGGILRIENDIIDNANGVIEALADSTLQLQNNAVIVGGLLQSAGTGQIRQGGSTNVFLEDLTVDADFETGNNSDLGITGTINNTGSILINSAGNLTDLEVQAAGATITGNGSVTLSGGNARVGGFAPFAFENGTFGGTGAVVVDSTFTDATLSAGLSIGTLNFNNSDSSIHGGSIVHEVNSTVEMPGINSDLLDVTGELDMSGVSIELVTVDINGDPAPLSDFSPSGSHKFIIALANDIVSISDLSVDTAAFTNSFTGVFSTTISPRGNREALIVRYGEFALADVNRDGSVNLLDVDPFVQALSTGEFSEEADVNCDGAVNLLDVDAFIAALAG